jgi:hypothetical protein
MPKVQVRILSPSFARFNDQLYLYLVLSAEDVEARAATLLALLGQTEATEVQPSLDTLFLTRS